MSLIFYGTQHEDMYHLLVLDYEWKKYITAKQFNGDQIYPKSNYIGVDEVAFIAL